MRINMLKYLFSTLIIFVGCQKEEIIPEDNKRQVKVYDFTIGSAVNLNNGDYLLNIDDQLNRVDNDGNNIWNRKYSNYVSSVKNITVISSVEASDGSIMLSGSRNEFFSATNAYKGFLVFVKIDAAGNFIWEKEFEISKLIKDPSLNDFYFNISNIARSHNDGFIISGAYSEITDVDKYFIFEIDKNGNVKEKKTYNFGLGKITKIIGTFDSGYIVVGRLNKTFMAKLDFNYNEIWRVNTSPYNENQIVTNVLENSAGEYFSTGYVNTGDLVDQDYQFFVQKINNAGIEIFYQSYGTSKQDFCFHSSFTSSEDLILVGSKRVLIDYSGVTNLQLIKVAGNGELIWQRIFDGQYGMEGLYVNENTDKTITSFGRKQGFQNAAINHSFYIRTRSDGAIVGE